MPQNIEIANEYEQLLANFGAILEEKLKTIDNIIIDENWKAKAESGPHAERALFLEEEVRKRDKELDNCIKNSRLQINMLKYEVARLRGSKVPDKEAWLANQEPSQTEVSESAEYEDEKDEGEDHGEDYGEEYSDGEEEYDYEYYGEEEEAEQSEAKSQSGRSARYRREKRGAKSATSVTEIQNSVTDIPLPDDVEVPTKLDKAKSRYQDKRNRQPPERGYFEQ